MQHAHIQLSGTLAQGTVEAIAQSLVKLYASGALEQLEVDLSRVSFVRADGVLALLAAARLWHCWTGESTLLTQIPQQVHAYLERANLFTLPWLIPPSELAPLSRFTRSEQSRTLLEITAISAEPEQNACDVTQTLLCAQRIVASWFTATSASVEGLLTMLAALAENIIHSGDVGHVIIQRYRDSSHQPLGSRMVLSIADLGIGIETSLRQNPAIVRQRLVRGSQFILAALKPGVTSRTGVGGAGLTRVQDIVSEWHGELYIRSQSSSLLLSPQGSIVRDDLTPMPGTYITISARGALLDDDLPF